MRQASATKEEMLRNQQEKEQLQAELDQGVNRRYVVVVFFGGEEGAQHLDCTYAKIVFSRLFNMTFEVLERTPCIIIME